MRNKQRIRVYSKAAPSWYAEAMLTHRKGTDGEDLYIIDSVSGKLLMRKIDGSESLGVSMSDSEIEGLRAAHFGKMIAIHNHPTNIPPSGSDFGVAGYRGYKFGIVVTHTRAEFTNMSAEKNHFCHNYLMDGLTNTQRLIIILALKKRTKEF